MFIITNFFPLYIVKLNSAKYYSCMVTSFGANDHFAIIICILLELQIIANKFMLDGLKQNKFYVVKQHFLCFSVLCWSSDSLEPSSLIWTRVLWAVLIDMVPPLSSAYSAYIGEKLCFYPDMCTSLHDIVIIIILRYC